jgi:hypothetical protein
MVAYTGSAAFSDIIDAPVDRLFDFLDDQSNLSSHMSKSSWMMLGSTMDVYMDAESTRAVGSKFGFRGAIVGVPLAVDEVVIGREPPLRKTWETVGEPCLWVIGRYRMGLELTPRGATTNMRVFIDYALPAGGLPRVLGRLFGNTYARWCTRKMVSDARRHYSREPVAAPGV